MTTHKQLRKQLSDVGVTNDTCGIREGSYNGTPCLFLYRDGTEETFLGFKDYVEPDDYRAHIKWITARFA